MHDFFFFQAEDGIRDLTVTGVQTCALPISTPRPALLGAYRRGGGSPNSHTGHRFARPRIRGRKRLALPRPGRAKRWPVWIAIFKAPSGCACGGAFAGGGGGAGGARSRDFLPPCVPP